MQVVAALYKQDLRVIRKGLVVIEYGAVFRSTHDSLHFGITKIIIPSLLFISFFYDVL